MQVKEIESDLAYLWQIAVQWLTGRVKQQLSATKPDTTCLAHTHWHTHRHTHTTNAFPTPPHQGQLWALPRIQSWARQPWDVKRKKVWNKTLLTYCTYILTLYTVQYMPAYTTHRYTCTCPPHTTQQPTSMYSWLEKPPLSFLFTVTSATVNTLIAANSKFATSNEKYGTLVIRVDQKSSRPRLEPSSHAFDETFFCCCNLKYCCLAELCDKGDKETDWPSFWVTQANFEQKKFVFLPTVWILLEILF